MYGVCKVVGETLGRYYSDQFGLSFIAIRLGGVNEPDRPNMRRQFPCAPKPPPLFWLLLLASTWVLPEPRAAPGAGAGWRRTTGTHTTAQYHPLLRLQLEAGLNDSI